MKAALSIAIAASLALGASAQPHNHARHHHRARDDVPTRVLKRSASKTATAVETETVWQVAGGDVMSAAEAAECLENGNCVIVGSSNAQDSSSHSSASPSASAHVFKEEEEDDETTTSSSSSSTSTSTSTTSSSSSSEAASSTSKAATTTAASTSSMLDVDNVDVEFPDNEYDCDSLPSGFGAVAAEYLGMSGWLGIQWGWTDIITGVSGDTCSSGAHCTYLCPEGYEKAQWPERQGNDDESIGGLYCNSNNKLVKTRDGANTLCQKGKGGVTVTNSLSETVYMCRTDYPGTEAMLIPIAVEPGTTHDVTNPSQTEYLWKGMKTSAQYYLNNPGLTRDQACTWDSDESNIASAGDKAPTNFGTGIDGGTTYFSIFPNAAVSTATLEYNVQISVDGEETCTLVDGVYSTSSSGCTGASSGGDIVIKFY
ncbi:hypothetical protein MKZ38_003125 [Zalerion maritima]|uniref:Uncharacterized protein n=1 Tax=Zalerion maritima TaxID=339359 RepID=A0AAD5RY01_9PEZI|nr:hypothetical protein MKZ38_003125 [Zalerion maritima]